MAHVRRASVRSGAEEAEVSLRSFRGEVNHLGPYVFITFEEIRLKT